jgi:2-furoate---CoA ligase
VGQEGVLRIKLSALDYHAYLDDEDATQRSFRDGYFYPGDMAVGRADGLIKVTGRVSDVLVVGGQKFATSPIEQSLQKLLQVNEVCLFSGADNEGDELVFVALETDHRNFEFESIRRILNPKLFQKVRYVCLESFPRNDTGTKKVKRDVLKRLLFEQFDQSTTLTNRVRD